MLAVTALAGGPVRGTRAPAGRPPATRSPSSTLQGLVDVAQRGDVIA
jgi:hypothetical protein